MDTCTTEEPENPIEHRTTVKPTKKPITDKDSKR